MAVAMKPKFLLILSLAMMLTPTILYWLGPLRRPAMADGDRLEMLTCIACSGSGKTDGKSCSRCRGKKVLLNVVPGPHRPTYVVGQVYAPDGTSVVPGAQVRFSSSAGSWERKTDDQGRFGADLGPGRYPVEIQSAQGRLSTVIEVVPQITPSPVDLDPKFPSRTDRLVLQKP